MAGFDDFDFFQRQSMPMLDDHNTAGDSLAKNFLYRERHLGSRFATADHKNLIHPVKIIMAILNRQSLADEGDIAPDRSVWICGFYSCVKNFSRVRA